MKIDLGAISQNFSNVEFFVACIAPGKPPEFQGVADELLVVSSSHFWAISSRAPSSRAGLVHEIDENFVVFRGYEASLGIHSYSSTSELARISAPEHLTNGVFSFLKFDPASQRATIKSDAFGIAPLFYREVNGTWLFSSHPGLVHLADDASDLTSWLSLMQNGYVLGDQSFYSDIKRFPAGTEMVVSPGLCETRQWFDFAGLPDGETPIDDEAIHVIENAYRTSMERCLRLNVGEVALPFTSGFDSRRFFAFLVRNKVDFRTVTCQSFNRKNGRDYDIDSIYAPKIAAAFGIESDVVSASSSEQFYKDFLKRQSLIGTETFMHNWAMPLMDWLSRRPPSLVFDGLAGDVFGNSSFDIEGLEGDPRRTAADIVEKATNPYMLRHLAVPHDVARDFREKYGQYVAKFSPNMNQSQLAFFQARTRRGVAPWITMMHPPGHVVVFPYCDVDFARAALTYDPGQKYKRFLQRECLQRFYPEFYDFAGSRNLPSDHMPVDKAVSLARDRAEEEYAYGDPSIIRAACRYLNFQNKAILLVSQFLPALRRRRDWLFRPLLTILRTQNQAPAYIRLKDS